MKRLCTPRNRLAICPLNSLIDGPEMAALYESEPFFKTAALQVQHIVSRPTNEGYTEVNNELLNVLTELVLDPELDAQATMDGICSKRQMKFSLPIE